MYVEKLTFSFYLLLIIEIISINFKNPDNYNEKVVNECEIIIYSQIPSKLNISF